MEPINLWEALTAAECNHRRDQGIHFGPRVTADDLKELGASARFGGQELNIMATPEGWRIKVFSCYELHSEVCVEILITKDTREPVKIVRDRYGRLEHIHD